MRTRGGAGRTRGSGEGVGSAGRLLLRRGSRLLGLIVVALLVVAIGVGVQVPRAAPPAYSASEQVQLDAEDRYRSLAVAARTAAQPTPTADPRVVDLLVAIAADLEVQAAAVALPRPEGSSPAAIVPTPTADSTDPTAGSSPAAGSTADAPASDAPRFLVQLRGSALASLADAVDADPGPARVLAAAGANQWQRALALGAALGVDPGLPIPDGTTAEQLAAGDGKVGGACAGIPLGSDADRQALQSARTAEDQARYGYEVAAALLDDRAALLERAAEHGDAADAASDRLVELCAAPGPRAAGFALPPAFRADPLGALLRLEQQHVDLHAGHVATTSPDTRAWATMALTAAVVRSTDAGATLQPLPGIAGVTQSSIDGGPSAPASPAEQAAGQPIPEETPRG